MNKDLLLFSNIPVIWRTGLYSSTNKFESIIKFDCNIVQLKTKGGGTYSTSVAVSPLEYRKQNKTKAKVSINNIRAVVEGYSNQQIISDYTVFLITDDWGDNYSMHIPSFMKKEIEIATKAAKEQDLLVG